MHYVAIILVSTLDVQCERGGLTDTSLTFCVLNKQCISIMFVSAVITIL